MGLNLSGTGGELRRGRTQVARLASWTKQEARVAFACEYVNQFAAGLGPPTAIVLPVSQKARRIYPVVAGTVQDGAVKIDLMHASTETVTP